MGIPIVSMGSFVKYKAPVGLPTQSIEFDAGSSQRLTMSDANFGAFNRNKFAISVWVKRASTASMQNIIVQGNEGVGSHLCFRMRFSILGRLEIAVSDDGDDVTGELGTNATYTSTTNWYHIFFAFDNSAASGNRMRLWVDGSEVSSFLTDDTPAASALFNSTADVVVGADYDGSGVHFDGLLYQLAFFSGSIPAIGDLYDAGSPKDVSVLSGLWALLDANGSVANDGVRPNPWTNTNGVATSADTPPDDVVPGWNLAAAAYDSKSFSVTTQETQPFTIYIKPDGTKMYVLGNGDVVYQYTLGTPWDISTASYDSVSFSVSAQDTAHRGIFFKSDGTKMYLCGTATGRIYQYSLGTPWVVSSASYDSVNLLLTGQDTVPSQIFIKPDGSKFYVMGNNNDTVYQYSMPTPWSLTGASYDSVSFSVTTQENAPVGLFFKDDGTKMYALGGTNDSVYQYNLPTPWVLTGASYDSVSFSVGGQDATPRGLFFKDDGAKMYMVGGTNDTVYQYSTV